MTHGMMMSPGNGGTGGGGGDDGRKKYTRKRLEEPKVEEKPKKTSTGSGYPRVKIDEEGNPVAVDGKKLEQLVETPIPVVFTRQTFNKLIAWTLGPLLLTLIGSISAFFYFYHRTNLHIEDPTIHLSRGERDKLENKQEARAERDKLQRTIKEHIDIKVREIKVEQREQIHDLGKKLASEQRSRMNKILTEVKKLHQ